MIAGGIGLTLAPQLRREFGISRLKESYSGLRSSDLQRPDLREFVAAAERQTDCLALACPKVHHLWRMTAGRDREERENDATRDVAGVGEGRESVMMSQAAAPSPSTCRARTSFQACARTALRYKLLRRWDSARLRRHQHADEAAVKPMLGLGSFDASFHSHASGGHRFGEVEFSAGLTSDR